MQHAFQGLCSLKVHELTTNCNKHTPVNNSFALKLKSKNLEMVAALQTKTIYTRHFTTARPGQCSQSRTAATNYLVSLLPF